MTLTTPTPLPFGAAFAPLKSATDSLAVHAHALQFTPGRKPDDATAFPSYLTDKDLDLMQSAGIKTLRTDLLWGAVERNKGQFDFSKYDDLLAAMDKRGIKPMFVLGLNNPHDKSGNLTIYPDSNKKAFMQYAKAAVQHFAGKGIVWELVQQPNQAFFWHPAPNAKDYADLATTLLPELKALDPSGHFIAPSLAGHGLDYQQALYPHKQAGKGVLDHADGVSVHTYRGKDRQPESILGNYAKTQALMTQHRQDKTPLPVILGEWGYNRVDVTPEQQARYATRQALMGMMVKTPLNVWFNWKGDIMKLTDDPKNPEQQFGLVNKHHQPHPAYHALKHLATQLKGYQFENRLATENPDHFVLQFSKPVKDKNPQRKWVAWTRQSAATAEQNRVSLAQGAGEQPVNALTLTEDPQFIEG
jgi:polysaccharide biosynthesis protein PslG